MPFTLNAPQVNSQTPQELSLSISAEAKPAVSFELRISIVDYPDTDLPTDGDNYISPAEPDGKVWVYEKHLRQIGSYKVSATKGKAATSATFTAASGVHAYGPGSTTRTVKLKFNQDSNEYVCSFQTNEKIDLVTIVIESFIKGKRLTRYQIQPWNLWRTQDLVSDTPPPVITYITLDPPDGYHTNAQSYWTSIAQGEKHIITTCHSLEAVIKHLSEHCDKFSSIRRVNIVAHGGYDDFVGHVGTENHPFKPYENKLQAYNVVRKDYIAYGVFLKGTKHSVKYTVTLDEKAKNPSKQGHKITIPKNHAGYDVTLEDHSLGGSNTQFDEPVIGNADLFDSVKRDNSTRKLMFKPKNNKTGESTVTLTFNIPFPVGSKFFLEGIYTDADYKKLNDDFSIPGWKVYYQENNSRKEFSEIVPTNMSKSLFEQDPLLEASRALQAKAAKFTNAEFFFSSCRIGNDEKLIDSLQKLLIPSAATYGALRRVGYTPLNAIKRVYQWLAGVQDTGNNNQPYLTETVDKKTRVAQPNPADSDHFYKSQPKPKPKPKP